MTEEVKLVWTDCWFAVDVERNCNTGRLFVLRLEWRRRELRAGELYLTAVGRISHGRIIVLAEGLRVFGLSEIH